jgi:hypothetical protein
MFDVIDREGKHVPYLGSKSTLAPRSPKAFSHLQTGAYLGRLIDLGKIYDLKVGEEYRVIASYSNDETGEKLGVHAWVGRIVSNEIVLRVRTSLKSADEE